MFQKFRPLHNNVLVQLIEAKSQTSGGLYIPDTAKQETQTGTIMATGSGLRTASGELMPLSVKIGDTIFFGKYAGTKADDKFVVLKEEDILGIIE
ncbi:co-chaperone GroES [candidate division TM6 bacterium RIFCSPHIGHO2_12_FULL_38_8]|nr:MAG: co-chaperone GroES [candidate division TM6 bacterium RIFCSPHIGHO2_12_FULL_38_8]